MTFGELLRDTFRTLWAHKPRTFLTMFGIAWGIISITLMIAAGEGLRVGQQRAAERFGKDLMICFAGRTSLQAGGVRAGRRIAGWRRHRVYDVCDLAKRFLRGASTRLELREEGCRLPPGNHRRAQNANRCKPARSLIASARAAKRPYKYHNSSSSVFCTPT